MSSEFWLEVTAGLVIAVIIAVLALFKKHVILYWKDLALFFRLVRRMRENGVSNFFTRRSDYVQYRTQRTISEYIETTQHSLLYVGFWLAQGKEIGNIERTIQLLLNRDDCTVELILLNPDLDNITLKKLAAFLDLNHENLHTRVKQAWDDFQQLQKKLDPDKRRRFVLAHHDELLTASAFVFDYGKESAKTLIDFKLFGASREGSFGIELRRGKVAENLYDRVTESYRKIRTSALAKIGADERIIVQSADSSVSTSDAAPPPIKRNPAL